MMYTTFRELPVLSFASTGRHVTDINYNDNQATKDGSTDISQLSTLENNWHPFSEQVVVTLRPETKAQKLKYDIKMRTFTPLLRILYQTPNFLTYNFCNILRTTPTL
jgi:hypothetical protein